MKVKIADVISQRLDTFTNPNWMLSAVIREALKDYLSDIDEEMAIIRRRERQHTEKIDKKCWYCGYNALTTLDPVGEPSWLTCVNCGATACKHPTKLGPAKSKWQGRRNYNYLNLFGR